MSVHGDDLGSLVTDEVLAMIGHSVTYRAPEPLSAASIRHFALAIGSDPQRWQEEAPPTLVCETTQLTGRNEPDRYGYLGHNWSLPFPVPVIMIRGGNDYAFHRPVRPSDRIDTTWTILDIVERTDRSGSAMAFVTAEAVYSTVDGELLVTNTESLIYRQATA